MCVTVSKQPWHLVKLLCRSLPLAFGIVAPAEPPGLTPCCTCRRTREIRSGLTRERLVANAASGDHPPEAPIKAPPDTQSWMYPVTARRKRQLRHRRTRNRGREHDVGGVGRHLVHRLALPVPMPSLDRQLVSSEASFRFSLWRAHLFTSVRTRRAFLWGRTWRRLCRRPLSPLRQLMPAAAHGTILEESRGLCSVRAGVKAMASQ